MGRSVKGGEDASGAVQIVGPASEPAGAEQSVGHDSVRVERRWRSFVLAEGAAPNIEELGHGEAQHSLGGLTVGFHSRDAIALQECERGPRIGVELALTVSPPRPVLVEVEDPPLADQVAANELERAEGDVTEILAPRGLAER